MSVTSIPGTSYTIQDNNIQDPDGNTISKDGFINEVQSKGINLNSDALKVLGEKFGTDYETKLQNLDKTIVNTTDLKDKVGNGDTADLITKMMILMQKTAMDQRKSSRELADKTVQLQINTIGEQVKSMKTAAMTRLITGVVTSVVQIGLGMAQMGSSAKAASQMKQSQQFSKEATRLEGQAKTATDATTKTAYQNQAGQFQKGADQASFQAKQIQNQQYAISTFGQSASGLIGASGNFVASMYDADVKEAEKDSVKFGHMTDNAKKLFDEATELERKVRDILQSMEQSEAQAQRSIANMG